jgi:hypothetical protein
MTATFVEFGRSAYTFDSAEPITVHTHLEIELVFVERGTLVLEYAGTPEPVHAGTVVAYWAGLPHGVRALEGRIHVAQLPVVEVLSWAGSARVDQLLAGGLRREAAPDVDRAAFARWTTDLATDDQELHAIAGLEMQARLRRCLRGPAPSGPPPTSPTTAGVAAAIRYVVRHYLEPFTVADVAAAAGWRRDQPAGGATI